MASGPQLSRQAKAKRDLALRHRINAGRTAIRNQIAFFKRQFGQVVSEWRPDDTRVTFADFAISENLVAELRRDFAEDDFCSEEANPLDEVQELTSQFAWVIDPIDGTNNYALGFPLCAISMALLEGGKPVYGFIYDHSVNVLYEGGPEFGVFAEQKKIQRDSRASEAQTMVGLHFPVPVERFDSLKPILTTHRGRSFGSGALNCLYVATGYLEGAIDFRVKVWDVAAAVAICAGAGVEVRFLESEPFPMLTFHAHAGTVPYVAGGPEFVEELRKIGFLPVAGS